jgi:hypothetical protein
MAGETVGYLPKEVKKGVLYAAEKSAWVTIPATVIFVATGPMTWPLGAALIAGDVVTSHWAGQERRKL